MRKGFFYGIVLVLSLSLMSAMCSSDDDGMANNTSAQIAEVQSIAETGTWRITNFMDSGQDETSNFIGYEFTFGPNGMLSATNGANTYTGIWSISIDDDSSGGDDDGLEFDIDFAVPESNMFDDLDDDWDIVSYSDTLINLIDIDDDGNDTDILTFERN